MEKERLREKFTCCSEAVQMLPKLCPAPTNVWETELALKKVLCAVTTNSGNLLLLWTELLVPSRHKQIKGGDGLLMRNKQYGDI